MNKGSKRFLPQFAPSTRLSAPVPALLSYSRRKEVEKFVFKFNQV